MALDVQGNIKYNATKKPKRNFKGKMSAKGMAKSALKEISKVKKDMAPELKWSDQINPGGYGGSQTISNNGGVYYSSNIVQGTTSNTRVGNVIRIQGIYIKGKFNIGTAITTSTVVRFMLVRDKMNAGSTPAVTDILSSDNTIAPLNLTKNGRFRVLFDECFAVEASNNSSATIEKYIDKQFNIEYVGTAGVAADAQKNSLWVLAISDAGSGTNQPVNSIWCVRLRYTDA